MTSLKYHIVLTEEESGLVDEITFELPYPGYPDLYRRIKLENEEPILKLLYSLYNREAIPKQRIKYWENPEYNIGFNISRLTQFKQNSCKGNIDPYVHLDFLSYLQYFLYGPDLPDSVIENFEHLVEYGLQRNLFKDTRKLIRNHRLVYTKETRSDIAEEFFKLCFEMHYRMPFARLIRDNIMRMGIPKDD